MKASRTDIVVKELCTRSGYDKRTVMQVYDHVLRYYEDKIKAGKSIKLSNLGEIRLKFIPEKVIYNAFVENEDKCFTKKARFLLQFKVTKPIKQHLIEVAQSYKDRAPIEY